MRALHDVGVSALGIHAAGGKGVGGLDLSKADYFTVGGTNGVSEHLGSAAHSGIHREYDLLADGLTGGGSGRPSESVSAGSFIDPDRFIGCRSGVIRKT